MTIMPRAATSPELAKLRSDNQSSRLYLSVLAPSTVYTARLAAVPSSTDMVASITYNTGSGTLANVLSDMTMLVGSTAGGFDYGICRIRKDGTTTAGTFYVGETSEVNWTANAYITIVNEFAPWARHPRIVGTTPYMDYDVTYTDQHSKCSPTPVIGPCYVAWLNDATVSITPDASQSWGLNNTITGYSWAATGASATSGLTTATPTITYNATGTYRIDLTLTASDGATFTGYRNVFVVNESTVITDFTLDDCSGDYQRGGWSFRVTLYDDADRTTIRDRAFVVLHSRDWYGDTEGSIGYLAGCENIVSCGWINGESIQWRSEDSYSDVSFDVEGAWAWLDKIPAFSNGLKNTTDTPTKWTRFQGLTAKAATWHMLRWRSTVTRCVDVFPCANTLAAGRMEAPGAQSLWTQLNTILDQTIIAKACADRYGRLHFQREQNLLTTAERAAVPTVMAVTSDDWTGEIGINRRTSDTIAQVDLSGVALTASGTGVPYFALSPGRVYGRYGGVEVRQRLVLYDQATTNTLAGLYCGMLNNEYPEISINFAANNRLIDIASYQYLSLTIASADTPRQISGTLKIIPRSVTLTFSDGYLLTSVSGEGETTERLSVAGDQPQMPVTPPVWTPELPPLPPTPIPTPDADGAEVWLSHYNAGSTPSTALIYSTDFFSALGSPTWHTCAALPADLVSITYHWQDRDGAYIYLLGKDTGTHDALWASANPKAGSPSWTKVIAYGDFVSIITSESPNVTNYVQSIDTYDPDGSFPEMTPLMTITTYQSTPLAGVTKFGAVVSGTGVSYVGGNGYRIDGTRQQPWGLWNTSAGITFIRDRYMITNTGLYDRWPNYTSSGVAINGDFQLNGYPDGAAIIAGDIWAFAQGKYLAKLRRSSSVPNYAIPNASAGGSYTSGETYAYYWGFFEPTSFNGVIYWTDDGGVSWRQMSPAYYWSEGKKIRPANINGGKFVLVAARGYAVTNSNEFLRHMVDISDPANNPWVADTGNMWTTIISSGSLYVRNFTVVYQ